MRGAITAFFCLMCALFPAAALALEASGETPPVVATPAPAEPTPAPPPAPTAAPQNETAPPGATVAAPVPPAAGSAVTADSRRWSGNNLAIFLAYVPLYHPAFGASDRSGAGNFSGFEGGVALKGHALVGIRLLHATVPTLQAYDPTAFMTTYYSGAKTSLLETYAGIEIPLNSPYEGLGLFQLFLPIHFGLGMATIDAGSGFLGLTLDAAAGLGVHVYTNSFFRAEVTGLYHFGIPLETLTAGTQTAQDPAGQSMKFSTTGFEMKLGISFLFPDAPADGGGA